MAFNSKKDFRNFGGVNYATTELARDEASATDLRNITLSDSLALTKRRGCKHSSIGVGGAGAITYFRFDSNTGQEITERLVFDDRLRKEVELPFIIEHSDNSVAPGVEIKFENDNKLYIIFYENGGEIFRLPCGNGYSNDEVDMLTIKNQVNGSGLNFTIGDIGRPLEDGSEYLAHKLPITPYLNMGSSIELKFKDYVEVTYGNGTITAPFATAWAEKNNDNFEIYSSVQHRNNLYIINKDGLFKYDGNVLVKAGLPQPPAPTVNTAPVSPSGDIYRYLLLYTYTDNNGIVSTSISPILDQLEVDGLGYTINLPGLSDDNYDNANVERVLLRTKANGNIFYVHPDYDGTTSTYLDNITDDALVEDYILPPFELNLVPQGKYIDVWRNQLVITGVPDDFDKVIYEDIEFPEGFSESNSFLTSTRSGGVNTGIKSLDTTLFVFKERSITAVTGALIDNDFQVDTLSDEGIGAVSQSSIIEALGKVWFVSIKGIQSVSRAGLTNESFQLLPLFNNTYRGKNLKRAISVNWIDEDSIIFSIPEITKTSNDNQKYADPKSRVLVYKTTIQKWYIWDDMDLSGGVSLDKGDLWWSGARIDSEEDVARYVAEGLTTLGEYDFADNEQPISCYYKDKWEDLGEPSVPKKFVRVKLFSVDNPLQGFETTDFSLRVETEHDYYDNEVESRADIRFREPYKGYGQDEWGNFPWGLPALKSRRIRLKPKKARSLRLIISNGELYENVLLSGFEYEIAYEHQNKMTNR